MNDYILFTDSACDLPVATLERWGIRWADLTFRFQGEEREYDNYAMPAGEFYRRLRQGERAMTSCINPEVFRQAFRAELEAGRDILYLGFSSGLSGTCQAAETAAAALREQFPQQKILAVDTLCASAGQALLLYLTLQKKREGADIETARQFALDTRLHICHWFTVDDLNHLHRGGRISAAAAVVGSVLGIKPILHMDDQGLLMPVSKVRGRKAALKALAEQYGMLARDPQAGPIFLCHGDCPEDAEKLRSLLWTEYHMPVELVVDVGPVIGAHAGPGTLSVFFVGNHR